MKIRSKLVFLILFTALSFILSYGIYALIYSRISNIEEEEQILQDYKITALNTRLVGSGILQNTNMDFQWKLLAEKAKEMEALYQAIESFHFIPDISVNLKDSIGYITNLRILEKNQYNRISMNFDNLINVLEQIPAYSSEDFIFNQLFKNRLYEGYENYTALQFYASQFETELNVYNYTLEASMNIVDTQFNLIKNEINHIWKLSFFTAIITGFCMITITLTISLIMADHIGKDTQKISRSLASMIEGNAPEKLRISRKDEIGQLAADLETIMLQLINTRDQLIHSEKMAALGNLTMGLAHEINTPLGISITAASYLETILSEGSSLSENSGQKELIGKTTALVNTNLKRISNLVEAFRDQSIARIQSEKVKIHLADYIKDIIDNDSFILNSKQHNVEFHYDRETSCLIDCTALRQIFFQFFNNAVLHGLNNRDEGKISINMESSGKEIKLSFSDNGIGMSKSNLDHIFEPFYTTARVHGKAGLGLYLVYNLVIERLSGTIICSSEIDKGTIFKIRFPVIS